MKTANPEELELAPGTEHEQLQGSSWSNASESDMCAVLEKAFDYRGDVTLTLRDGSEVEGYIFDRRTGETLSDSVVRLIPAGAKEKLSVRYSDIGGVAFTGRDTAAGKSWQAWVKKYLEKKAAGESNIELTPESLD